MYQERSVPEPYIHSDILFATSCDPLVSRIAHNYFSRQAYLATVAMYRIEPTKQFRGSSYQWHHDSKGKQVKAMLLLTEVGEEDQRMTYLKGSHKAYRFGTTYEDTRFETDEKLQSQIGNKENLIECTGPAGTVIVFDTNGLHSGNRNEAKTRDVLTNVYWAKKPKQAVPINGQYVRHTDPYGQRVVCL